MTRSSLEITIMRKAIDTLPSLCSPIDTLERINVGLIRSLAIHARIGHWGSLENPFFYNLENPFYEISKRSKKLWMLFLSQVEMHTIW